MDEALSWPAGFRPYVLEGGTVQIRAGQWRGDSFVLAGGGELLLRLIQAIDGHRTSAEVLAALPLSAREAGGQVLQSLMASGLLFSRLARKEIAAAPAVHEYMALFSADAHAQAAGKRVLVIGAGALGSRVAVGLAELGVGALTIADDDPVTPADRQLCPAYLSARPGTRRAAYLARVLKSVHQGLQSRRVPLRPMRTAALTALLREHDFVICAEDRPVPWLWDALNRAALEAGTPWVMLTSDSLQAFVGPAFFPAQSGCSWCWEQLQTASMNRAEHQAYQALRQGAAADQRQPFIGTGGIADLVAGFLLADLPRLLTGRGGLVAGRYLTIDFVTLACCLHDCPRLPRCPACGSLRQNVRQKR